MVKWPCKYKCFCLTAIVTKSSFKTVCLLEVFLRVNFDTGCRKGRVGTSSKVVYRTMLAYAHMHSHAALCQM